MATMEGEMIRGFANCQKSEDNVVEPLLARLDADRIEDERVTAEGLQGDEEAIEVRLTVRRIRPWELAISGILPCSMDNLAIVTTRTRIGPNGEWLTSRVVANIPEPQHGETMHSHLELLQRFQVLREAPTLVEAKIFQDALRAAMTIGGDQ
jgi:hypothetical protein